MKTFRYFLLACLILAGAGLKAQAVADITGVWKGYYYQQNYLDTNAQDLAYKAQMTVEQQGTEVSGTCVIYWYDNANYWGRWRFSGTYENGQFNYTEFAIDEDHCKPGFSWCLKEVESFIQYNPQTAGWMFSGKFKASAPFAECSPGKLFFEKEKDI